MDETHWKGIEVMQEPYPFPIIIDNFLKIICVGHFECMITGNMTYAYVEILTFKNFWLCGIHVWYVMYGTKY